MGVVRRATALRLAAVVVAVVAVVAAAVILRPDDDAELRTGSVVLAPDGLGVVRFGDPARVVTSRLRAVLGPPDENRGRLCRSAPVRTVRWGGLSVVFTGAARPAFTAWQAEDGGGGRDLRTASGLRPGMRVHALDERASEVMVDPDGRSFRVVAGIDAGVAGTLSGDNPNGRVRTLTAGPDPC